jgi:hypothetical protein
MRLLDFKPDKHIYVEKKAGWDQIADALPQLDEPALLRSR